MEPGAHATSAGVAPPRPPRWEALAIDGCQHARAAAGAHAPREVNGGKGGDVLKRQSRQLCLSGLCRVCSASSTYFTISII